jgi:hypothetical protein
MEEQALREYIAAVSYEASALIVGHTSDPRYRTCLPQDSWVCQG